MKNIKINLSIATDIEKILNETDKNKIIDQIKEVEERMDGFTSILEKVKDIV